MKDATAGNLDTFLKEVPLFGTLSDPHLAGLAKIAVTRAFPKEAIIFHEGDYADALYLIRKGKVKVVLSNPDGKEVIISVLGTGDYFGELALIDDETRCARVVAMTPCQVTLIGRKAFNDLLAAEPLLSRELLKSLAARLRQANRHIGDLVMLDVFGRVARVLLGMVEQVGGEMLIRDLPTQREIAGMVGATREMVNKVMKDLMDNGYITVRDKVLVVNEGLSQHPEAALDYL